MTIPLPGAAYPIVSLVPAESPRDISAFSLTAEKGSAAALMWNFKVDLIHPFKIAVRV